MRTRFPILAFALTFALACLTLGPAGCMMGPDYERPGYDMPQSYRGSDETRDVPVTFGELAWFEVFKDPVLQKLIREALANNYDIQAAAERVLQAREQVIVNRSYLFPSVGAGAQYENLQVSNKGPNAAPPGTDRTSDFTTLSGFLTWELDFFGRYRRATEAARADFLAQEENRLTVIQALVTDLTRAYLELLDLDYELAITNDTVKTREKSLSLAKARYDFGYDGLVPVRMAENLYYSATKVIPELQRQITQKENQICMLLGRNPGPIERGSPLLKQSFTVDVPPGLPANLLARRPDLRTAEQQLIAANARIGEAEAQLYPNISLSAQAGFQSMDLDDLITGTAGWWDILAGLTQPIFNAGRLRANVRASEAAQREAALNYKSTILSALVDVSDALTDVRRTREYRIQQEHQTKALAQQVELADLRYQGGVTNYLEYLDSEREYFQAELELTRARRDELLSVVSLYRALGGGWEDTQLLASPKELNLNTDMTFKEVLGP